MVSSRRPTAAPDVFVHVTAVEKAGMRSLVEGQKVSFEVVMERGKKAGGESLRGVTAAPT